MKNNVVVIHGGKTFKNYKEYLRSLKERGVSLDVFQTGRSWRNTLEEKLGKNYQVLVPRMPNGNNAVYVEWKVWFERMTPFIGTNSVLVGHSLGGIFLAKYFAENVFPKKVKAIILIAAPFDECNEEFLGSFALPPSIKNISNQIKYIYLLFSQDDPVVPPSELNKYVKALPGATAVIFHKKKHFNQDQFPELVALIKKIYR